MNFGRFIRSTQHPELPIHTAEPKTIYASFPYFGPTSSKLRSELETVFRRYFPFVKLEIIFQNSFKIGSFFHYKDVLPLHMKSCVIYSYCCPRCGSGRYIGSTNRPLYMRISEHIGVSFRTGNQLQCPSHSSIRDHALNYWKSVNKEDF